MHFDYWLEIILKAPRVNNKLFSVLSSTVAVAERSEKISFTFHELPLVPNSGITASNTKASYLL